MSNAFVLAKEKIVSISALQKNPSKALDAAIVRIVKNGEEIGIYMSKAEFEDFIEEHLPLKKNFVKELDSAVKSSKSRKRKSLDSIL